MPLLDEPPVHPQQSPHPGPAGSGHTLTIKGLVDKPMTLTLDALQKTFPAVTCKACWSAPARAAQHSRRCEGHPLEPLGRLWMPEVDRRPSP